MGILEGLAPRVRPSEKKTMEVRATAKYIKVQPRKVRIIAATVRGMAATEAAAKLRFHPSKGAFTLRKVLVSAIANAVENNNASPEGLRIAEIHVDEGPRMKRMQARAMGRGNRITKKTSHITVVVEDYEPAGAVKPHGTKAKARPTFDKPKGGKKKAAPKADAAVAEVTEVVEEVVEQEAPAEVVEVTEEVIAEPVAEVTQEVVAEEAPAEEAVAEESVAESTEAAVETHETVAEADGAESEEKKD